MKTGIALLLLSLGVFLSAAQAQTGKWPEKPVRTIVPFAPGGSIDLVARLLGARLTEEFGQQFVVDNRGGAGGAIGAEITALARPDGYTIILVASSYAIGAPLACHLPTGYVTGVDATANGWKIFDADALILTYEYSFGPGTANALAIAITILSAGR